MSDRQTLAEHGTGLMMAGLAAAGVVASGAVAPVTSIGVLTAWGIDRYKGRKAHMQRDAVMAAADALKADGYTGRGLGVALALLKERGNRIEITPARLAEAEVRGNFTDALYNVAFKGAGVPTDDGVEDILRTILAAAYQTLRQEDGFHKILVQESVAALETDLASGFARIEGQLNRMERTGDDTNARVRALEDRIERLLAEMHDTARQFHINEGLLMALARRYGERADDFESALAGLQLALETASQQQARDANPSNLGEAVDKIVAEVSALNEAQRMEEADALLLQEMDRLANEIEEKKAAQARILDTAISQAIYTADAAAVAQRTLDRIRLDTASIQDQFDRLQSEFGERWEQGLRFGSPFALEVAIELAKKARSIASTSYHVAASCNDLGNALYTQGTRSPGPEGADLLAQAVTAYRAALEVRTRADHPVQWATTQNNLGNALRDQDTRTAGPEGADLLAQAVAAYRAALEVRTRADHPVHWAQTQNNLAVALRNQGTRTAGPEGADLLAQAVAAYRAALEVRTRADHPVQWAETQNNLGAALDTQGTRTAGHEGADLLAQAVNAYRAALEVRTRADHPVQWAETQMNVAFNFKDKAQHDSTASPEQDLRAALDAVTAALEVYDPEHMSYDHGTATRLRDRIQAKLDTFQDPHTDD